MATKNRKELEDAFKEFEAKGGKVTKVKPGRAGGLKPQVTTPNRRGPSGKGGSVISYTFPKTTSDSSEKPAAKKTTKPTPAQQTRENLRKLRSKTVTDKKATNAANAAAAKKKADAKKKTNAKKKTDANKKPPSQKTPSTKLPVPIKVVKKAVETGTLNDLYRAMGQRAGELRKWLRSNKDQIKPKPDRAQTKKPGTDLVPIKKRPQAKSSIPSGGRTTSGAKTPPKVDAKPKTSTKPQSKTTARSLLNKIPKNVQQGLKAAARTTPAVVTAGVLGKQSLDNKGKGSGSSYTVKKGDTLSEIARDKGTTLKALLAANKITAKDANKLSIGKKLTIPGKVKDRKSVYQGMTKPEMAAMQMSKKTKAAPKRTNPKPNVDDFSKMPKPKVAVEKKRGDNMTVPPAKKKTKKERFQFYGKPGTALGDFSRKYNFKYDTRSPADIMPGDPEFQESNKHGGQIKGYKKGGKVKGYNKGGKVTGYNKGGKVSRPRGVGCAIRGYGKAMK